jgi:hypothetical protein
VCWTLLFPAQPITGPTISKGPPPACPSLTKRCITSFAKNKNRYNPHLPQTPTTSSHFNRRPSAGTVCGDDFQSLPTIYQECLLTLNHSYNITQQKTENILGGEYTPCIIVAFALELPSSLTDGSHAHIAVLRICFSPSVFLFWTAWTPHSFIESSVGDWGVELPGFFFLFVGRVGAAYLSGLIR